METKEEATKRERYYILKFRSNEPEYGYNKHTNFSSTPEGDTTKKLGKVKCIETGETFKTATAAGAKMGCTGAAISHAIKYKKCCKGYHWVRLSIDVKN